SACVPHPLVLSTARFAGAAAGGHGPPATAIPAVVGALTEGVLRTMFLTRLKTLATAVAAGPLLLGTSPCASHVFPAKGGANQPPGESAPPAPAHQQAPRTTPVADREGEKPKTDREQLQGNWRLVRAERYGMTWVVRGDGELVCQDKTPKAFPIDLEVPRRGRFSGGAPLREA